MASSVKRTAVVGTHYTVTIQHPSGNLYVPRFVNVLPAGYADLPTYQAACQAVAITLIDTTTANGPNATSAIASFR